MAYGGKAYREAVARAAAKAAAKKAAVDQAIAALPAVSDHATATEALLSGVGKYVFENQRASCHPDRLNFKDGKCYACTAEATRRLDSQQRPAAEVQVEVAKLGEAALAQQVKGYLQHNLEEYARLHVEAARVAAFKGDARPAEWALQSVKVGEGPVVAPPAKEGGPSGVKVLIGVQLGGLPPGTVADRAITVASEPVVDTNRVTDE
jgi:hypothetical protein